MALAGCAWLFYLSQNRWGGLGGEISLPKLMWLAYALLLWFVLPAIIAGDVRLAGALRRIYTIFFYNMAVRGGVELWMLYGAVNWHPYYGATHDLFSIGLLLYPLRRLRARSRLDSLLIRHSYVLAAMLCAEIGFALYFAANFRTSGNAALYFVPAGGPHSAMIVATSAAVGALSVYLVVFGKRWLYATDES